MNLQYVHPTMKILYNLEILGVDYKVIYSLSQAKIEDCMLTDEFSVYYITCV